MKVFVAILLLLHAILHLLGTVKAFYRDFFPGLSREISRSEGVLWLVCSGLLIMANIYYLLKYPFWPVLAIIGALLSQFLITVNWENAKYGTVLNILILGISFPALTN